MKDLVDFQNRVDFDQYMRSIEKNYYEQQNLVKPPYEQVPAWPPKPYQSNKQSRTSGDQGRDFIDKVNDSNVKRQTGFSYNANPAYQASNTYVPQQNTNYVSQYNTPFFESVVNKENFLSSFKQPVPHQTTAHYISGPVPHGNIPQGFLGDKYGPVMEPHHMPPQQQPPYMQKFVAGPQRLEQNPLSAPSRHFNRNSSPTKSDPNNFDLKNPDGQYERYKQLMSSGYYNQNANSAHQGPDMTGPRTIYMPPAPFNVPHGVPTHISGVPPQTLPQQDVFNMSFNPNAHATLSHLPHQAPPHVHSNMYPQSQQMYPRPNSVSLYQQPPYQNPNMPLVRPDMYSSIKFQNGVTQDIIESIGGIQDTLKPLQDTLKQHELRPYQIQKDFRKELYYSQHGKSLKRSSSEVKPENMHLVSVSPYRAVVKLRDDLPNTTHDDDSDEEIQRMDTNNQLGARPRTSMSERREQSPVKNDSEIIRGHREDYLNSFSQKRQSSTHRSNQKIKNESEYMRSQREQFLTGFSAQADPYQKPPLHTNMRNTLQIQV